MERIEELLLELNDNIDYKNENALISNGVLDSVELVELVTKLEEEYEILIPLDEISPDNFDSIENILHMIQRIREQKK